MALIWIFGFLLMLSGLVLAGQCSLVVPALYLLASIVTFIAYALDKAAARQHQRRTRERTLHLLSLSGGWPGALLAQKMLRHKSSKRSFRWKFALVTACNCLALVLYLAAINQAGLRPLVSKLLQA